jgi:hypothetical protein
MLPSHLQELLTASVDGELTKPEQRLADQLLLESEEARAFHTELLADSQRLRRLPRAVPVDDLAARVMNLIEEGCLMPTPLPMPRRKPRFDVQRWLPWISMATAAGVLIVVSLFSHMYFAAVDKLDKLAQNAKNAQEPDAPKSTPPAEDVAKVEQLPPPLAAEDRRVEKTVQNDPKSSPKPDPLQQVEPKPKPEEPKIVDVKPPPKPLDPPPINTGPVAPDREPFRVVESINEIELLLPLKDLGLDDAYPKRRLREELKKGDIIHIDLFCKDAARGADLLNAALKAKGQQVLVDGTIHDRLKKSPKTKQLFYSETLTLEEIAKLLEQLGADDKRAESKKSGDGQFDSLVVVPFNTADRNELAKLLGILPSQVRLPNPKGAAIDPTRPLENATAGQVAANLAKSQGRNGEKLTLVLPYGVNNHFPQNSKETKTFLDKRGDHKSVTTPMMLVLRPLN